MGLKEDKIKKAHDKAVRESEIVHAMADINSFRKDYKDAVFWPAVNRIKEKLRIEKQATKEIADAEAKLEAAKRKYGK